MVKFRRGPASSFGWLRRPELDANSGGFVWERPDGELYVADKPGPITLIKALQVSLATTPPRVTTEPEDGKEGK